MRDFRFGEPVHERKVIHACANALPMLGFSRIFPEQLRNTKIRYGVAAETVAVDPTRGAGVLLRVLLSAVRWVSAQSVSSSGIPRVNHPISEW
jgi:hypothetical protein